jgi:hypothetical protein
VLPEKLQRRPRINSCDLRETTPKRPVRNVVTEAARSQTPWRISSGWRRHGGCTAYMRHRGRTQEQGRYGFGPVAARRSEDQRIAIVVCYLYFEPRAPCGSWSAPPPRRSCGHRSPTGAPKSGARARPHRTFATRRLRPTAVRLVGSSHVDPRLRAVTVDLLTFGGNVIEVLGYSEQSPLNSIERSRGSETPEEGATRAGRCGTMILV